MRAETGNGMWECNYGKEPLDIRLLVLRFLRKSPLILAAALLGALGAVDLVNLDALHRERV